MNTPRKMSVIAISAALASGMSVHAVCAQTTAGTTAGAAPATSTTSAAGPSTKGESTYLARVASRYQTLSSRTNLESLVHGLRTGTTITLTGPSGTTAASFTPPTRPMGYGNITRVMTLASRQLAAAGITNPTPQQLQTALMGGTLTTSQGTATFDGVLQLRSQGMGWGEIAHTLGVRPGEGTHRAGTTAAAGSRSGISAAGDPVRSGSAKATQAPRTTYGRGIVTAAGTPGGTSPGNGRSAETSTRGGLVTAAGAASGSGIVKGGHGGSDARGHSGKP